VLLSVVERSVGWSCCVDAFVDGGCELPSYLFKLEAKVIGIEWMAGFLLPAVPALALVKTAASESSDLQSTVTRDLSPNETETAQSRADELY
jgi:hypothetical protein